MLCVLPMKRGQLEVAGVRLTDPPSSSKLLFAFTTPLSLVNSMACIHVRLLGPCFKTGRRDRWPTRQRDGDSSRALLAIRVSSKYPSGVKPGQPGLQARPITSPNAIGRPQTVPAVNCGENAPVHQAQPAPLSLLIRQDRTAQRQGWVLHRHFKNPSVYHHTVSCTIELSLQSSFQSSVTVLVCYRSQGHI